MSDLLTVREVAARLGIRTHAVLALIRNRQLKAADVSLNPGGRPRWRIDAEELASFIQRRTPQPKAPRRRKAASIVRRYF